MTLSLFPWTRALTALLLFGCLACSDPADPAPPLGERGVVLNSLEVSLTIFSTEDPVDRVTVGLAPEGSPVSLAVRGNVAAVPLGFVPGLAVVDLEAARLDDTVVLPPGSGATGVAFLNDSIVLVGNPDLNTVSPVNVRAGTLGASIAVGVYPQTVVVVGNRVAVVNAVLGPDFLPEGPGTVTILDRESLDVLGTVTLSGENPGTATVGPDGLLYVVHSGNFGAADGSLSVVDPTALQEVEHHPGFGEFPFAAAFAPGGSVLYVGSFGYGLSLWDAAAGDFLRDPANAVQPEGVPSISGLGFDMEGRLYTLRPECSAASAANRLLPSFEVDLSVPVGICPIAITFTSESD